MLYDVARHSLYQKVKAHRIGLEMHRVQKLHIMSLVIQTF